MFGLVEVITLLLGLSGFGLQANPQAPTADQALQYAIADADLVVHVDITSIVPSNYKAFTALPNNPQIKASPELSRMVKQAIAEVDGARNIAIGTTGIDPTKDIGSATLFVQYAGPNKDPNVIAAVRGKFSPKLIEKIAGMAKAQATTVNGAQMVETGTNKPAIALTKDGVMLAGTAGLVRARLDAGWKPPARTASTSLGYAAEAIDAKPVFSVSVDLSAAARKDLGAKLGPKKNFGTEMVARHKLFAFAIYHDGIGWTWIDQTRAGMDQMALMSEGTIELLRASHLVPRGISKILLGAIDSYKGTDKRVDEIIARKADIMKIVESYTGDGNFKVAIDKDVKTNRLTVRATGKTVSEVIPAGFIGPAMMVGWLTMSARKDAAMPPPPMQMPAPTQIQPKKKAI